VHHVHLDSQDIRGDHRVGEVEGDSAQLRAKLDARGYRPAANGYREYSLRDAVELARVRRLTELGLSLDEVGDALAGDADRDLVEILRELDADLARQEADLRQRRARLAQLLRQAEAGGKPSEQAPVSPGLAELFDRMARVATGWPEPAMAAKDRDVMALLETVSAVRGTGWLDVLTRTLNSDPEGVGRAYAVYARLDELAGSPVDDPRVEATARAIVAAIPEPARQAIRFPDGGLEETDEGFAAAFYADFALAQAAAIRRAINLMSQARQS
jgi:DNA-binding transcriptional MerR regulator